MSPERLGRVQAAGELEPEASAVACAFFFELDAWTEYWDIYHPETKGHYYFGDGDRPGLLGLVVPRQTTPPIFAAWRRWALGLGTPDDFSRHATEGPVAAALGQLDDLVADIFDRHYGDARDEQARAAYLRAIYRFATDTLPPAPEREARVPPRDLRRRTAGRHTIDVPAMWFIWAMQLEGAGLVRSGDRRDRLRALLLAGVATGAAANFSWRGHRRTRPEYQADEATRELLFQRGMDWAADGGADSEVHRLYQLMERGYVIDRE